MLDVYAMRDNPRTTAWLGAGFVAAMVAVVVLVLADFNHAFSSDIEVTADVPQQGAVVSVNSSVFFHGVEVGKVMDQPHTAPGGEVQVHLRLDRDRVDEIPRSVRVVTGPLSIFGNQYINLVASANSSTSQGTVRAGMTLPAVSDAKAPTLQATFVSLDDVLKHVHPAQLNAGLSGLAQALSGRGTELGRTLVSADRYLKSMLGLWPTVMKDFRALTPFANTLAAATPGFLDLLRNVTVTADTLVEHTGDFGALMSNGGKVANQVAALLRQTAGMYATAIGGAAALFDALSQGPSLITNLLVGMKEFAATWVKTIHDGSLHVLAKTLRVSDPAELALALASGQHVGDRLEAAVRGRLVNPPGYTSADCPKWGTGCGGGR